MRAQHLLLQVVLACQGLCDWACAFLMEDGFVPHS